MPVRPPENPGRETDGLAFFIDESPPLDNFQGDVIAGLGAMPKSLPAKYFYDAPGLDLFARICRTPEYYVTRTEQALLDSRAQELAALAGPGAGLLEFGSGGSGKVERLLDALQTPLAYVALDINRPHLLAASQALAAARPGLPVGGICADFTGPLRLPDMLSGPGVRRVGLFLGSTIGNFPREEAAAFLARLRALIAPGGALLIGVDLKKDPSTLEAAYNDGDGATAAFNLNLLHRMVRELDADLDVAGFRHMAFYNHDQDRVEMHLESLRQQAVRVDGHCFNFQEGETIHTECSYKNTAEGFQEQAAQAGFSARHVWSDPDQMFSLHWLETGQ